MYRLVSREKMPSRYVGYSIKVYMMASDGVVRGCEVKEVCLKGEDDFKTCRL